MRGAANYYYHAVLLIVVLLLFGLGLSRLFVLRFERGDIYPPYSSLRSDPLGTKALYLSLGAVPGVTTARGVTDPAQLKNQDGATILVLGEGGDFFGRTGARELEGWQQLAAAGNRLVVGFLPRTGAARLERARKGAEGKEGERRENAKSAGRGGASPPTFRERWGIAPADFADDGRGVSLREATADPATLPARLPRRSRLFFRLTGGDWRTVYRSLGEPVVVEKRIGKGSVVLICDSYPFSNEALRGEPSAPFLVWIVGGNRRVVFDEFHLGVGDTPGMGSLARKYRLEPFLAALLLLALLYLWKSSIPFLREPPLPDGGDGVSDKDHFTGLVSLLARSIPREKLLSACFGQWRKSFSREYRGKEERLAQVEALLLREAALPSRKQDPEGAYREIARLLAAVRKTKAD